MRGFSLLDAVFGALILCAVAVPLIAFGQERIATGLAVMVLLVVAVAAVLDDY